MNFAKYLREERDSYFLLAVLPVLGWLGLVVFSWEAHVVSKIGFIVAVLAFVFAWHGAVKISALSYPSFVLRLGYFAYLAVILVSGLSGKTWHKSMRDLAVMAIFVPVLNLFVTLLYSWLVFELSHRQTKKAS